MKLDGYVRVSRVGGREGDSFISTDVQQEKIEAYATARGHKIDKMFTDLDRSGGKMDRPDFNRAMERVEQGKSDGIIVAHLDRFGRNLIDSLQAMKRLDDVDGEFVAVAEAFDTSTPMGKAMMRIALIFAELTLDNTRESWRIARRKAVERGVHIASKVPTGYRGTIASYTTKGEPISGPLEKDPASAPHIEELFRQKAAGASWRDLAMYLREHDVASPYGNQDWQPRSIQGIVENRVYLGEARSGEFKNPEAHHPLIDEATWLAAQQRKGVRSPHTHGGSLLSGLLRCAGCGYVLKPDTITERDGTKARQYRCRTHRATGRCPAPASVLGRVIEPFVIDTFRDGLLGMRAEGTPLTDDLHGAEADLDRAQSELAAYVEAVSAADVGAGVFAAGAKQRREAVEDAQARLDQAREKAGLADLPLAAELDSDWPDLTTKERNQLLRAGIDRVVLSKGRVPIDQRAQVVWRGTDERSEP